MSRIDLEIETAKYIYIIELKYGGSPQEAIDQINRKQYNLKFDTNPRQLILIGANFDPTTRRLGDWIIEE